MTGHPTEAHEARVEQAARLALARYGFVPAEVSSMERMPQNLKNFNYRVLAGGEEWVLKFHQSADAAERLTSSHRLEVTLADAGFPTPRLKRDVAGSTFVRTEMGVFTLHSWVEGQQISIAEREVTHARHPDFAQELGSMVGDLHRLGGSSLGERAGLVDVSALLTGPCRHVASIRHGRPHPFAKTLRLRMRTSKSEFDKWILRNLRGLYEDASALASPRLLPMVDPADTVLGHNDLNWENLFFDSQFKVRGVIDFDNAAPLPRGLGVGAAAAVLVGPDQARLDLFLHAYSAAAAAQVDLELVQLGMRWKCVRSILWSIDSYLSGRIENTMMIHTWCRYLHHCLRALPPLSR